MIEYGLTKDGFRIKNLDTIKTELEDDYRNIFGENIVLTPQSPQGQEVGVWSNTLSILWQELENCYNSSYPSSAVGVQLSLLVLLNGLTRNQATKTVVTATITGTAATFIPAGSLAATTSNSIFVTQEDVTIPGGGSIDTEMQAQEFGEIPAAAGTLTVIETPISGWDTIDNTTDGVLGKNEETDSELRERQAISTALAATNIIDALYSALLNVDAVRDAVIYVNNTNITDAMGVPAHRYLTVVDGGADADVAKAIYLNHTSGDKSYGNQAVNVENSRGFLVPVEFSRPIDVNIYVIVNTTPNSLFPADGVDQIKQAIVDYANGELDVDICDEGFKIAQNVIYSRLFTPVNSVCGHDVQTMFIGTTASPTGVANITIDFESISRFDISRVEVNIV